MKKTTIVNIYNFIRMSHQEPSRFIQADFDTIARQIRILKQYGLPSTYALKYDALMDPHYQQLLLSSTDENDEIAVWWEISEPLCRRAGVSFRGKNSEVFDERVDSAYSTGYDPAERRRLVDAYMADFHSVFGYYPKTMGSWILDEVTVAHAREKYGVIGAAICRDQIGTDGFTLWGGWPNGIYMPGQKNLYLPAQTAAGALPMAAFRLLSPDPLYSFEQEVRTGLDGVYTLEPSCENGRDPQKIAWYFNTLTEEDGAGIGYAQAGQENNFLWENIRPGFEPQVRHLKKLCEEKKIRLETMAESAEWFLKKYAATPPLCWQASDRSLSAQWYASRFYRIGFLAEEGHLRIRDWFLFDENYPSRYLDQAMTTKKSTFDALPLMFPQSWKAAEKRPFVRLLEAKPEAGSETDAKEAWQEPQGVCSFHALDELSACAQLTTADRSYRFTMQEDRITLEAHGSDTEVPFLLHFDCLPVFEKLTDNRIRLSHEGFSYDLVLEQGRILTGQKEGLSIAACKGKIRLRMGTTAGNTAALSSGTECSSVFTKEYLDNPAALDSWQPGWLKNPTPPTQTPPFDVAFFPESRVFDRAKGPARIELSTPDEGAVIRYACGSAAAPMPGIPYQEPVLLSEDSVLRAASFLPDGRISDTAVCSYHFGWKDVKLESNTEFDLRHFFDCGGISGLLKEKRGTCNWQDGCWLATLENLDFICTLPEERLISTVLVGFLTSHRAGIIYPEKLELYLGEDAQHLKLFDVLTLPEGPAKAEIERADFGFYPNVRAKCLRFVAKRYALMPQWCCYKGSPGIFTLADNLIIH